MRKKEMRNIDAINWTKFFLRTLDLKNQLGHWQSRATLGCQGCRSMKLCVVLMRLRLHSIPKPAQRDASLGL